jgi:hypothetical protein
VAEMKKNFLRAYLAVSTVFCMAVIFFIPLSFKSIIFGGIFIINIFLFLDVLKKD